MRSKKIVDLLISRIPRANRRWCNAEGGCCCNGCVGNSPGGITKDEWENWKRRHDYCESCNRYDA